MTLILYEEIVTEVKIDTHAPRAQALADTIAGSIVNDVKTKPKLVKGGLNKLIYWGHGNGGEFCGKSGAQIAENIAAWQSLNTKLDTVELISCNLGHAGSFNETSFTDDLIKALKINKILNKLKEKIIIKTLPAQLSAKKGSSILLWDNPSLTWAYITGDTEPDMFIGKALLEFVFDEDEGKPGGHYRKKGTINFVLLVQEMWMRAVGAKISGKDSSMDQSLKNKIISNEITMRAGHLRELGNYLISIEY